MIRFIASDIDGTLVADGTDSINPAIFDVIMRLKSHGIQFAAASGRPHASIEYLFAPIVDQIFFVSENGAYIGCNGRTLFTTPIDRELIHQLIREVREIPGCEIMLGCPDAECVETDCPKMLDMLVNGYHDVIRRVPDLMAVEDDYIKLSMYYDGDVVKAAGFMKERWSDRLKVAEAGLIWLDFMEKSVSKGAALSVLQEALQIRPEETMVFGDQINDIEMLRQASYSFAVANARPETRQTARYLCDSNQNDGVLQVLCALADRLDAEGEGPVTLSEEELQRTLQEYCK